MQDSKEQQIRSVETLFWEFLKVILEDKDFLNEKIVGGMWPGFTEQQLLVAQPFEESASTEIPSIRRPRKPRDFSNLENCLKKGLHQSALLSLGAKLLIYCTFKACIRTAEEAAPSSFSNASSENKEKGKLSSFARWGKALVLPMAEALIKAPGQDPVQTLVALATKKLQEARAAIAAYEARKLLQAQPSLPENIIPRVADIQESITEPLRRKPESVLLKPETKQEHDDSAVQPTSQATIQTIQGGLSQGDVEVLLNQLNPPAGTLVADSEIGVYLERQALTDIVKAQAEGSEKAELKDAQQANLIKAMEVMLQADPLAVVRPNKEEGGLTPLDTAIKLGLPENVINRLQQAEQVVYDNQITALQEKVEQLAKDSQEPEKAADLVSSLTNSVTELQTVRKKLNRLPVAVASTPLASSSVSTPIANPAALVNTPVGLSAAQQAQIDLGQQFLRIKLTQVFVEALAIKYRLVDSFNQSRTGAVAKGAFILIASLVPIPGASLLAQGIVEGVEFAATKGAQAAMEDRDKKRQTARIGKEIETIEQAAAYVAVLTKDLTRRFQLVFARLAPESLEVFVNRAVDRMVDYWDMMSEKLKEAKASRELLHERLVDCTQKTLLPLPPSTGQVLTENQQFDNLIENLLLGVSLWNEDSEIDAAGRLAGIAAGMGRMAKAAGFIIGDRAVYWQNAQGSPRVAVRHICRHAPAVTWTGHNHHRHGPTYYYGNPAAGSHTPIDKDLPPLYRSKEECDLLNYVVDQSTPAPLSLKIPPKALSLSDAQRKERELEAENAQLRQQLEVERARADREKNRADAAETRANKAETALGQVKEVKRSTPQKLSVPETKAMSTTQAQLNWNPRAIGQIPVSPSSPSQPPDRSLSTQSDSPVNTGEPDSYSVVI